MISMNSILTNIICHEGIFGLPDIDGPLIGSELLHDTVHERAIGKEGSFQ